MIKVDLIHPRNDNEYHDLISGYSLLPPPSGLEILAAYLQRSIPNVDIKVYDGWYFDDVSEFVSGDFIGISDWFTNHKNAMQTAKIVKEKNSSCKVIVGGPNASNLGERILLNRPYVDYVVVGNGEEALLDLVNDTKKPDIPNLWYKDAKGGVHFSFRKNINLNDLPSFDFSHLVRSSLEQYDSRDLKFQEDIDRTPIPISSIRGCIKSTKYGKCSYCNIPIQGVRLMKPEKVWGQVKILYEKYGINSFFETGDDFVVGNYPGQLLKTKPEVLDVRFRIYSAPDKIDDKTAEILRKIGVREVFMGIENINPEILARANKNYDVTKIEDSIRNCEINGIRVFLPFLFGLPGETEETAKRNAEFAHKVFSKYNNVNRVLYSLAVPVVGCSWFHELARDSEVIKMYPQMTYTDNLDYALMTKLSIQRFCSVGLETLLEMVNNPPKLDKTSRIASYGDMAHKIKID